MTNQEMPSGGGAYIREKDGTLRRLDDEAPASDAPLEAPVEAPVNATAKPTRKEG